MSESKFFAVISRMKYINRWALMRNTINENISEHSLEVAFIAHVLALIRNKRFGGNVSPERCALLTDFVGRDIFIIANPTSDSNRLDS